MLFAPSGKGRKRQKKGEKGGFRPISRKSGQAPLKPPSVTPPFAAAQSSYEQVHLNTFGRAPDSCHTDEGKSSRELFEKVRVNAPLFGISGFWVGFSASIDGHRDG